MMQTRTANPIKAPPGSEGCAQHSFTPHRWLSPRRRGGANRTDEVHRLSDAGYGVDHSASTAPLPPPISSSPSPLQAARKKVTMMMAKTSDSQARRTARAHSRELLGDPDDVDMLGEGGGTGFAVIGGGGGGGGDSPRGSAQVNKRSILVENRTDLELVVRCRAFGIGLPGIKPNETLVGGYSPHGAHAQTARKKESSDQMQVLKTQLDVGAITQEEYDAMVKAYKKSHTLERELDKWQAVKNVRSNEVQHPVGEVKCMPAVSNTVAIHFSPALKGKSPQYREAPICTTKASAGERVIVYYNCDGYVVANGEATALSEIEARARDIVAGKAQSKVHCSACGAIVTCPPHAALGTVSFRCPNCNTLLELNVAGQ
eukprot:g1238.t1